jgi:hypothetical protein
MVSLWFVSHFVSHQFRLRLLSVPMSNAGKEINREQLYAEVWQTPMSKLAATWGVPIGGIIKACEQMNVPRPGGGHWQLVKLGWQVDRDALPPAAESTPTSVVIRPPQKRTKVEPPSQTSEAANADKKPRVEIPVNLDNAHRLVKQTRKALTDDTHMDRGFVRPDFSSGAECPLSVRVSPESLDRSLRIMDAIVKGVVERGGRFERGPERWRLRLIMGKQPVEFEMTEARRRLNREFTAEERESQHFWSRNKFEWKGTGLLRFHIHEGEDLYKRGWEESKRDRLEDKVPEIIEYLASVEQVAERNRAVEREWKRKREEEQEKREIEWRREEEEKERRKLLEEMAERWGRARQLRSFIRACERLLVTSWGEIPAEARATGWLRWAREHADQIDPLTAGYLRNLVKEGSQDEPVGED